MEKKDTEGMISVYQEMLRAGLDRDEAARAAGWNCYEDALLCCALEGIDINNISCNDIPQADVIHSAAPTKKSVLVPCYMGDNHLFTIRRNEGKVPSVEIMRLTPDDDLILGPWQLEKLIDELNEILEVMKRERNT